MGSFPMKKADVMCGLILKSILIQMFYQKTSRGEWRNIKEWERRIIKCLTPFCEEPLKEFKTGGYENEIFLTPAALDGGKWKHLESYHFEWNIRRLLIIFLCPWPSRYANLQEYRDIEARMGMLHKKPLRENNQLDLKISSNQAFWTRFNKKEKNTATQTTRKSFTIWRKWSCLFVPCTHGSYFMFLIPHKNKKQNSNSRHQGS